MRKGSRGLRGKLSPHWRGGRYEDRFGYVLVYVPRESPYYPMIYNEKWPYVYEHRLIMAMFLGRCLTSKEIIHHLDGVKDNNKITNLKMTTRKQHIHAEDYKAGYQRGYDDGLRNLPYNPKRRKGGGKRWKLKIQ